MRDVQILTAADTAVRLPPKVFLLVGGVACPVGLMTHDIWGLRLVYCRNHRAAVVCTPAQEMGIKGQFASYGFWRKPPYDIAHQEWYEMRGVLGTPLVSAPQRGVDTGSMTV